MERRCDFSFAAVGVSSIVCGTECFEGVFVIAQPTSHVKPAQRDPKWFVIDAEGLVVGRLATQIATVLMGKHKPEYSPHLDMGDYVVVTNVDKVRFSGGSMAHEKHEFFTTKMSRKVYRWHSLWPGGLKTVSAINMWSKKPDQILLKAVKRMLPKNALARHMLDKLKLYAGPNHPHQSQQPQQFPEYLHPITPKA